MSKSGSIIACDETITLVTFCRMPKNVYAPNGPGDLDIIRDFNKRHKHTPASAWEIPDFST